MNRKLSDFLRNALQPTNVVLIACLILFLSTTAEINRLERQVNPAIVELKGFAGGYGIDSFIHEYLADPFGKAIGLSEHQLQLCRQISDVVPAYESSLRWRNNVLLTGILTLVFIAYKRNETRVVRFVGDFKRRMNLAMIQLIMRRWMSSASERVSKMQHKPIKKAVISNIVPCPSCHQELRVPSGKGRILITCSACGNKFETTT